MAQFSFYNDLKNCMRMDEPITKGPVPRWQKKCLEDSSSSMNASLNVPGTSFNLSASKSPGAALKKTPSKTPKKSPGRNLSVITNTFQNVHLAGRVLNSTTPTPGKGSKTPNGGDRFIPSRNTSNFELGHFLVNQQQEDELLSPVKKETQRAMSENLHGSDIGSMRILSYQNKAPAPPEGFQNPLKIVYSHSKTPASIKAFSRYIPQTPDRILDAPAIMDDYYLNLIDWSPDNILAVALGSNVYLWNADLGAIEHLLTLEGSDYVCSLAWIQEGSHLAVGTSLGVTQLWDCSNLKRLRVMAGHTARVGSLAWNSYILTSGSRSGYIIHHDVRQREHCVATLSGHTQEVCGLKWSPDGRYLASGGNDNLLNIWPGIPGQMYTQAQPLYTLSAHQAAVKALAWCPWHSNVLASGGGTADRTIRFWNCNTGTCLNTIDTKSQVCALLWSRNYKEFVSGHGYANNQLIIWKYPAMTKVAELTGHTARVLHLAMSPDGTTVLSAGADETLRIWKCFVPDASKKKEMKQSKTVTSIFKQSIR